MEVKFEILSCTPKPLQELHHHIFAPFLLLILLGNAPGVGLEFVKQCLKAMLSLGMAIPWGCPPQNGLGKELWGAQRNVGILLGFPGVVTSGTSGTWVLERYLPNLAATHCPFLGWPLFLIRCVVYIWEHRVLTAGQGSPHFPS